MKSHFDNLLDPKLASPARGQIAALEGCKVLAPLTVRLSFSRPFAAMVLLASATYGFNSPAPVQRAGRQYGRRPIGT